MEIKNVALANSGPMQVSSAYRKEDFHAKEFINARKLKKAKLEREKSKKIVTLIVTIALSTTLGAVATMKSSTNPNIVENSQVETISKVVKTAAVPTELTGGTQYFIEIYENGDALFLNSAGEKFGLLNGIDARTLANQLGYIVSPTINK